jgi:hypothetical protein
MNRTTAPLLLSLTLALAAGARAQVVITANSTGSVSAFSPVDGSLVNATFVPIASTGGTKVGCIEVNGEIWVSEQTGDRIVRYSSTGTVLGVIGPTFSGGGLDNCRGMSLINGQVHIANDGALNGAVANSLTVFDLAGNFVAAWPLPSTTSPYSVIDHQGGLVVASADANDDLHRYTYAGTSLGTFHNTASVNFAHQVARALDGNVWCATFTTSTVVKLDATTGNVLMSFPASNARGVFELWNGNVLWTSSTGVRVYDMVTQTSTLVQAGAYGHANLFGTATAASATPYGSGCDGLALAATGLPLIGNGSFALALSNVPAVSPVGLFAFGSVALNPGIDLTALGMPGCSSYTSLDIGLLTGGLVASGVSTFALPLPNDPALAGVTLASQGASFSATTALGLATSNGVALLINP